MAVYGGTHFWSPLRARLTNSIAGLMVADFNGDGRADVATSSSVLFDVCGRSPIAARMTGQRSVPPACRWRQRRPSVASTSAMARTCCCGITTTSTSRQEEPGIPTVTAARTCGDWLWRQWRMPHRSHPPGPTTLAPAKPWNLWPSSSLTALMDRHERPSRRAHRRGRWTVQAHHPELEGARVERPAGAGAACTTSDGFAFCTAPSLPESPRPVVARRRRASVRVAPSCSVRSSANPTGWTCSRSDRGSVPWSHAVVLLDDGLNPLAPQYCYSKPYPLDVQTSYAHHAAKRRYEQPPSHPPVLEADRRIRVATAITEVMVNSGGRVCSSSTTARWNRCRSACSNPAI